MSQTQTRGRARYLPTLPATHVPKIVCQLMFTPNRTSWDGIGECGAAYDRKAFDLARALIETSLFFTAENEDPPAADRYAYPARPAERKKPSTVRIFRLFKIGDRFPSSAREDRNLPMRNPYTSVALAKAIARRLPHFTERKSKAA
jgi:hypothetical protein